MRSRGHGEPDQGAAVDALCRPYEHGVAALQSVAAVVLLGGVRAGAGAAADGAGGDGAGAGAGGYDPVAAVQGGGAGSGQRTAGGGQFHRVALHVLGAFRKTPGRMRRQE